VLTLRLRNDLRSNKKKSRAPEARRVGAQSSAGSLEPESGSNAAWR